MKRYHKTSQILISQTEEETKITRMKTFLVQILQYAQSNLVTNLIKKLLSIFSLINNKSNIQMVYILPGPNTMSLKQSWASQVSLISVSATASELLKVIQRKVLNNLSIQLKSSDLLKNDAEKIFIYLLLLHFLYSAPNAYLILRV